MRAKILVIFSLLSLVFARVKLDILAAEGDPKCREDKEPEGTVFGLCFACQSVVAVSNFLFSMHMF